MESKRKLSLTASVFVISVIVLGSLMIPSANARKGSNEYQVEINAQLQVCHPPDPCFMATLQAHASGPADSLTGMLLISPGHGEPEPPDPCFADLTGTVQITLGAPTVRLTGTLHPPSPSILACAGGLQGVTVTLFADSSNGNIVFRRGEIVLASGTGSVNIFQTHAPGHK